MILPLPTDMFILFLHLYVMAASLALALVAHEIAHYLALRKHGKNPKIVYSKENGLEVGKKEDYVSLTDKKLFEVYFSGIAAGFLVLIPAFAFVFFPFGIALIAVYLIGCKHDLQQIGGLKI